MVWLPTLYLPHGMSAGVVGRRNPIDRWRWITDHSLQGFQKKSLDLCRVPVDPRTAEKSRSRIVSGESSRFSIPQQENLMFERWILMDLGYFAVWYFDCCPFWWLFQQVSSYILFPMWKWILTDWHDMLHGGASSTGGPFRVETFHHVRQSPWCHAPFFFRKTGWFFPQNMSDFQIMTHPESIENPCFFFREKNTFLDFQHITDFGLHKRCVPLEDLRPPKRMEERKEVHLAKGRRCGRRS